MRKGIKLCLSVLFLLVFLPSISVAGYIGSELQISTAVYNQQNPYTIFLPDKNLYLVVWEDWRDQFTTGANIYGQFIDAFTGNNCGDEFIITNAPGNQTVPKAAYRINGNKIIVVWQDSRSTVTEGFIGYTTLTVETTGSSCIPTVGSASLIAFDNDANFITSRVMPKVTYDEIKDRFLIAWVESRTTRKTSIFQPFSGNSAEPSWVFGDNQFVGYAAIRGDNTSLYKTPPTIITRINDIRARLVQRNISAMEVVSEYEFFDNISNVDISCDSTTPECLFVWEGLRGKFVRTDKCENNPVDEKDKVCDANDSVSSTATVEYNPTNKEIFGIFEKNIPLGVLSLRVSNSNTGAFYPSIGFDPISKRFLVAWEDSRDNIIYKKIYGQLIYSGSGLYNHNFIISFQDTNGDGIQDSNVANSKQTQPFVSYDAVNQRYFVVWQDGRNSTLSLENLDIYGQKVDLEGSLRGNNYAVYNLPFNQLAPVIANNPIMDEFLAVWKDARNTDNSTCGTGSQPCGSDIFGQLFTLAQPAISLLNPDNTHLAPPLLKNFENPKGSGVVEVGLSDIQSFKIKNTGDTILMIDSIEKCDGDISPFTFVGLPSELEATDGSTIDLVPSAELTLTVKFAPTAAGSFNRCFVIVSNAGRQTVNLSALAGIGRVLGQQRISVSPSMLNFCETTPGVSKTAVLTISNEGESPLTIGSISKPKKPFSIVGNSCSGQTLRSGDKCEVTVSFNPRFRKIFKSSLTIKSNDPTRPRIKVEISGIARF